MPPPGGEALAPEIGIDDFAKVDLRIAKIVDCAAVPGSDKLLRFLPANAPRCQQARILVAGEERDRILDAGRRRKIKACHK